MNPLVVGSMFLLIHLNTFGLAARAEGLKQNFLSSLAGSSKARLSLCFREDVMIDPIVRNATKRALAAFQAGLNFTIQFACDGPQAVNVTFGGYPSGEHPQDALAATRVLNGRILPDVRVFCFVFRALFRPMTPDETGQAYATAIYHELRHYLRQQSGHAASGIDSPVLSREDLLRGSHQ